LTIEAMMNEPLAKIRPGMAGRKEEIVVRELTVGDHVPGMPLVYGTPMMIFLMEVACGETVGPHLPSGWVTVGAEVNIRHLAPTPIGRRVVATARVLEVAGRSVLFAVEAHDGQRKIGEGTHRRGAVEVAQFMQQFSGA
jgi:fluoroacetyl-CoA thioesterase